MNACPVLTGEGAASVAAALRGVDCVAGQATAQAFGRLFGADGRLLPALTLLLTLYVALFAIGLLTGRTRIGVAALTPRMLTLGLVLTFATSWAAYSQVVWTLAAGAPDQIAGIVTGTHGSATATFAGRLDRLFDGVAATAEAASRPAAPTEAGVTPATPLVGGFSASTVLWVSALMLLLGTVGVLVTAKIALAALLALGPIFIVLALFGPTRGLFEGWAKATVLFALVPLLAVLIGGGAVLALDPVVRAIGMDGERPDTREVAVLFLGASVYVALMVMAVRTATVLVTGWRMPGAHEREGRAERAMAAAVAAPPVSPADGAIRISSAPAYHDERVRGILAALPAPMTEEAAAHRVSLIRPAAGDIVYPAGPSPAASPRRDARVAGIGSRFRMAPARLSKEHVA